MNNYDLVLTVFHERHLPRSATIAFEDLLREQAICLAVLRSLQQIAKHNKNTRNPTSNQLRTNLDFFVFPFKCVFHFLFIRV